MVAASELCWLSDNFGFSMINSVEVKYAFESIVKPYEPLLILTFQMLLNYYCEIKSLH